MKKVRLILSAAIVLFLVGSALAFKTLGGADVVECQVISQGLKQCELSEYSTNRDPDIPDQQPANIIKADYTLDQSKLHSPCTTSAECGAAIPPTVDVFLNP